MGRNFVVFCVLVLLALQSCGPKKIKTGYSKDSLGYWWQLMAFSNDSSRFDNKIAWVEAVFSTQNDSVFYDSRHDLRDRYFIHTDTAQTGNFIRHRISRCSAGDSICMLIKTREFFDQQFISEVPFFSKNDTVVKVKLKVKQRLDVSDYNAVREKIAVDESKEIESFFGSAEKMEKAFDQRGFYWVQKPRPALNEISPGLSTSKRMMAGSVISLAYTGSFLDGRVMDVSPAGFQITYGTPDQVIKGLNIVIGDLISGQNSKIILPSHLAFGESGSSNGSIPPFTPMLYEIKVLDIKQ